MSLLPTKEMNMQIFTRGDEVIVVRSFGEVAVLGADNTVTLRSTVPEWAVEVTDGEEDYERGYCDGVDSQEQDSYDEGYTDGHGAGTEELEEVKDAAYAEGYAEGEEEGYSNGYSDGYDDGLAAAYATEDAG
jgi:flagellar biosynthesis/type III secretory pathway protein FliH